MTPATVSVKLRFCSDQRVDSLWLNDSRNGPVTAVTVPAVAVESL